MQEEVKENILELMTTLSTQGHSGFSAPYVIHLFKQLAMYDTILPLTGEDDEWQDVSEYGDDGDEKLLQNRRLSSVFKRGSEIYDVHSIIFHEEGDDNVSYSFSKLVGKVEFPYTQTRFEVSVPKDATPSEMIAALNARHIPFIDRSAMIGQPEA